MEFTTEDFTKLKAEFPAAFYFMHCSRLERELQKAAKGNAELEAKLHSLGPQPSTKE